jgi:Uma2 family endonuclease
MESAVKHKLSLAEYQQLEENTDTRYEYHDGEVFAMAGGTLEHSAITSNVLRLIGNRLSNNCRTYESNLKIYVDGARKSLYPDVSVACRPVNRMREINAITNPILLVEVLSKSTANYDRGDKFWFFSQLASLREYVLIEQDSWKVETRYRSSPDKHWEMAYFEGENTEVVLRSLDIRLAMNQIYQNIEDF